MSLDYKFISTCNSYWDNILVLSVESGKKIRTLIEPNLYNKALAISKDSKLIASGSSDKTIKIWRVESGAVLKI